MNSPSAPTGGPGRVARMPGRGPQLVVLLLLLAAGAYQLVGQPSQSRQENAVAPPSGDAQSSAHTGPAPKVSEQPQGDPVGGRATAVSGEADAEPEDEIAGTEDLLYNILREVSAERYLSPAGLLYTPGSAQGHRLEHLRRHTKNDPSRSGNHGVFDGGMTGTLKTVDQAYARAIKGDRTTRQVDGRRTIYTVDMGRRVGYVGGREGDRRRNPMARRVRLVLEGNRVITAYPL